MLLTASLLPTGSVPVTAAATGLVAAFGFSEGAGTTTADASGNGNVGTLANATWTASGKFGNALTFDGVSSWVTVSDAVSLRLTTGVTLEAWVNPSRAASGWSAVVLKENPAS